jgi:hypothetical protein
LNPDRDKEEQEIRDKMGEGVIGMVESQRPKRGRPRK